MAVSINFTAKVSNDMIEVGQRFQVTFTVNASGGKFNPPPFTGFQIVSGPNRSQNVQYINGNVSQSNSLSYILQATKKGNFTIGSASIDVNGSNYKTKPIKIKVVDANPNGSNAHRNNQNQQKSDGDALSKQVFLKATVDKRSAYVGEKITVTYKLYYQLNLRNLDLESTPSMVGFWTHDVHSLTDQAISSREQINGKVYEVALLQQTVLYPQRSGELTIESLSLKMSVQAGAKRARSIREMMFGAYEYKDIIAKSKPIKLNIKPLPSNGKPSNFSGAVGQYNMRMSANKDSVVANEAIDVKIEISGSGNLPLIGAPKLNFPNDFEVYDPETKDRVKIGANGANGSKSFKYLVIPRHSGTFNLEPYSFSYFDLASKTYKTINAEPISFEVGRGNDEENVVYSPNRKEEIELLNTDIRYIHLNDIMLVSSTGFFYQSTSFYALIVLAIALAVLFYFLAKKLKIRNADYVGMRKSKANKLAKKRLAKAKSHLDSNNKAAFYEEISIALHGYFADKFNISIAELSQEKIIELLENESGSEEIRNEIRTVLEEAEMARFAPESSINATILYEKSADIIRKMEDLKV